MTYEDYVLDYNTNYEFDNITGEPWDSREPDDFDYWNYESAYSNYTYNDDYDRY